MMGEMARPHQLLFWAALHVQGCALTSALSELLRGNQLWLLEVSEARDGLLPHSHPNPFIMEEKGRTEEVVNIYFIQVHSFGALSQAGESCCCCHQCENRLWVSSHTSRETRGCSGTAGSIWYCFIYWKAYQWKGESPVSRVLVQDSGHTQLCFPGQAFHLNSGEWQLSCPPTQRVQQHVACQQQ